MEPLTQTILRPTFVHLPNDLGQRSHHIGKTRRVARNAWPLAPGIRAQHTVAALHIPPGIGIGRSEPQQLVRAQRPGVSVEKKDIANPPARISGKESGQIRLLFHRIVGKEQQGSPLPGKSVRDLDQTGRQLEPLRKPNGLRRSGRIDLRQVERQFTAEPGRRGRMVEYVVNSLAYNQIARKLGPAQQGGPDHARRNPRP